jgi:hypothetical protein
MAPRLYFTFTFIHCHSAQVFVTRITVTGTLVASLLQLITKLSDIPSTAHSTDSHRSSTCLKFFVLTVLELWKQNFLPAVFTQPTLQVTKPAYLARKQRCAASWLPCLRILSLGRFYIQSKPWKSELNKGKWEPNDTNKRLGTSIGSGRDLYSLSTHLESRPRQNVIPTEKFREFAQHLQENSGTVYQIRLWPLPTSSFLIHYLLTGVHIPCNDRYWTNKLDSN